MLQQLRIQVRKFTPSWLQGCTTFFILVFLFGIWVHHAFQGHWWGPFLPGSHFGTPENLKAELGIFPTSQSGWDGQFYFYQSNDLFASQGVSQHIDNPPYRYQRIGVPMMAQVASRALGERIVSPVVYHLTQILCVAVGYAVLVFWLRSNGHSSLWALAWISSDGVINALSFGMPDPVGDAMFIIAAVGILKRKLPVYIAGALILPLVREAYAVTCGVVFLATWTGFISWKITPVQTGKNNESFASVQASQWWERLKPRTHWCQIVIVSIPCLLVASWHMFLYLRFGQTASQAGRVMVDYPLVGWWQGLQLVIERRQTFEILLHLFAMLLIIVTSWTLLSQRYNPLAWICLPYIGLLTCMSWVAWEDYSGYMKACGTIIVMLLLFLPRNPGALRYGILFFLILEGAVMTYKRKDNQQFLPYEQSAVAADPFPGETPMTSPLSEYSARIEVLDMKNLMEGYRSSYNGIWKPFHRSLGTTVRVRVTNTSSERWSPLPTSGLYAINLSYQWINPRKKRVVLEQTRVPLSNALNPGSVQDFEMPLAYPRAGTYILRISMIQEGCSWFYDSCPQFETLVTIP